MPLPLNSCPKWQAVSLQAYFILMSFALLIFTDILFLFLTNWSFVATFHQENLLVPFSHICSFSGSVSHFGNSQNILYFNINLFILIEGQLLYNIVLVLPYINMNPPRVYTCSQSWNPLPPPSPYHPSGSSQCTSPEHPVSCIKPGLAICFIYDNIHVSMPSSQTIPPSPSPT